MNVLASLVDAAEKAKSLLEEGLGQNDYSDDE